MLVVVVRVGILAAPARRTADGPSVELVGAVLGLEMLEDDRGKREERDDKGEVAEIEGSSCETGRRRGIGVSARGMSATAERMLVEGTKV